MSELTIRAAVLQDAPAITRLNLHSLGLQGADDATRRRMQIILQNPAHCIFVAEAGDAGVVGYLHAGLYEQTFTDTLCEAICLAVDEGSQGGGVGRALMQACEGWARRQGAAGIWLTSTFAREGAHAFYKAIGYTHVQDRRAFKKVFAVEDAAG